MSDRLQKLLRQRALLQEHLAWLDREIAEAEGVPPLPADRPLPSTARATVATDVSAREAEEILGRFQQDASGVQTDTRRGCLIIFSIAMGLLMLAAIVGYYFYGRHLGRWW